MTQMREAEELLRGYLADGPAVLSDRTYDVVRATIERTPQGRAWPWRDLRLSIQLRVALVAATLVLALVAVLQGLPSPNVIGPGSSPTPSPTPSPTATPLTSPSPPLPTIIGQCTLTLTEYREVRGGDPEAPEPFPMTAPYHAAMQTKSNARTVASIGAQGNGWGEDGPRRPVVSIVDPDGALIFPGVGLGGGQIDTSYDFDKPGTWTLSIVAEAVGCTQVLQILIEPEPSPTPPPSVVAESSAASASP